MALAERQMCRLFPDAESGLLRAEAEGGEGGTQPGVSGQSYPVPASGTARMSPRNPTFILAQAPNGLSLPPNHFFLFCSCLYHQGKMQESCQPLHPP